MEGRGATDCTASAKRILKTWPITGCAVSIAHSEGLPVPQDKSLMLCDPHLFPRRKLVVGCNCIRELFWDTGNLIKGVAGSPYSPEGQSDFRVFGEKHFHSSGSMIVMVLSQHCQPLKQVAVIFTGWGIVISQLDFCNFAGYLGESPLCTASLSIAEAANVCWVFASFLYRRMQYKF